MLIDDNCEVYSDAAVLIYICLVNSEDYALGKTTISNDGATILKLLDVVFPAAQVMVDIAKSQDAEVGDGTTSGECIVVNET